MRKEELRERLESAIAALNRADFTEAIEGFTAVVAEDSSQAEAWQRLGVCYLETRQPQLAVEALTRSIQAEALDATTHYLLGNACGSAGELERAAACYRRALELDPQHAKAEEFLIRTESLLESRQHYRNGVRLLYSSQPSGADLSQALRELVQSMAIFEASPARDNLLECARKLLALQAERRVSIQVPRELEKWAKACERGHQCVQARNWPGARAAFEEALAYRPQDAFVHHALGFALAELGELDQAVRAWLRTAELDPGYDFSRFGRIERAR